MSIKKLFDAKKAGKIGSVATSTGKKLGDNIESIDQIQEAVEKNSTFVPKLDYSKPENFVKYGSAYRYYYDTFTYIKDYYPYDGSSKEKLQFFNDLTPFEQYILDNEYPRTTGYVTIGATYGADGAATEGYTTPTVAEHIQFKGGPHSGTFFATGSHLSNNLEFGGVSGSTIEFFYNKTEFDSSISSPTEVILDIWNGAASSSHDYGRLTIETNSGSADRFYVTYQSGTNGNSNGVFKAEVPSAGGLSLGSGSWDHYAFVLSSSGNSTSISLYENGTCKESNLLTGSSINLVTGSLIGRLGALRTQPSGTGYVGVSAGDGKLSASLDEFRFWKEPRTSKQIGQNWFSAVNGGANTTYNNSTLGVYFKFNEGITGDSATDATVLDYSGRLSNGTWTGYSTSGTRNTGSAIVSASAANFELADPIIYDAHPSYTSSRDDLALLGETYDFNNNSSLYYTLPGWIIEEDEQNGSQIAILTQIMGSYLDTLHAQITNVLTIKDKSYVTGSNLESPNNDRLLSSLGFEAPELFESVNEIVRYLDKDDKRPLEKSIHQIKNIIYKNLYNNLSYILKSKGTRKSFTNTLRCMGIDEKLVKISTYGDNIAYSLTSSYKETAHESKYVDFSGLRRGDDTTATVYQYYYASGYDGGSSGIIQQNTSLGPNTFTLQADINFPLLPSPGSKQYVTPLSTTSSLYGFHTPSSTSATETDTTWANAEVDYGLQVFAVHAVTDYSEITTPAAASKDAYFMVKDRLGNIILQTDTMTNVYSDSRWVLSLNVRPETYPFAQDVDGAEIHNHSYIVELYGANYVSDLKNASFQNSSTVNFATGSNILTSAKRVHIGAHRTNNTGSIIERSDVRIGACRAWNSFLTSSEVDLQAKSANVYGSMHPYRNINTFQASGSDVYIPSVESLMLNWDFETVTGSDTSGQFRVDDFTSGSNSTNYENNYQAAYSSAQRHHSARGDFFKASDTPVRKQYIPTLQLQAPEEISSDDMITVILEGSDDDVYGRDRRPIRYSFAVEKSMYDGISNQMLEMFGSIKDFNNLIGEPVNKYRAEYKDLGKLREIFFRRVTNNRVDIDKYLDYYKWLDGSLTNMVEQLFPASAPIAENVRNVVESHVLERNKYQHKYPTLEMYPFEPSGSVRGGFEQQYSWRFNHHPVSNEQNVNCSWWFGRAERDVDPLNLGPNAAADAGVLLDKKNLFNVTRKSVLEENRKKLYKFDSVVTNNIVGGANELVNKSKTNVLSFDTVEGAKDCTDAVVPPGSPAEKVRQSFRVTIGDQNHKGNRFAPFSLYNALNDGSHNSLLTDNGLSGSQITNLHEDSYYGSGYEVPMQGPFTRTHVGGLLARASGLRMQTDHTLRRERFRMTVSSGTGSLASLDVETGALSAGKGHYYRGLTAKAPVNIANIAHITSSISGTVVGNFDKNYQVVQTSGRSINNLDLRDDPDAYVPNPLLSPYVGDLVETPVPTRRGQEYTTVSRTLQKSVFTERFSAPGGVETSSPAYLDFYASELSPNNALPFRNALAREIINGRLQTFQGFGGHLSTIADSLVSSGYTFENINTGSFGFEVVSEHDTQRNAVLRPSLTFSPSGFYSVSTGSVKDNAFITHPIPRADRMQWLLALSGTSAVTHHDFFNSGSVMPAEITVPVKPSLIQGQGYDGTRIGGTVVAGATEISKLLVDGTTTDAVSSVVSVYDKFVLSGTAFVLYDTSGVGYGFCLNLSGTTGPSGPESDLTALGISNVYHVNIGSTTNAKGVLQAISSSININAAALDNSIDTYTFSADNDPSTLQLTFTSETAITDIDVVIPTGVFANENNDEDVYDAAAPLSASQSGQLGTIVTTQGVAPSFTRAQLFENMSDYRVDDTSAVFSGSDGTVHFRWGVGQTYNGWQQVRQSQIRSRESIMGSNVVKIYDRTINDQGSVVESERSIPEPVLQLSYKPIDTMLSIVDEHSPEDDQIKLRDIGIEHSYANQKVTFVNGDTRIKLGGKPKSQMFVYDSLRDIRGITFSKTLSAEDTGVGRIKKHKLNQQIFPKAVNVPLSSSQLRDNYSYTRWRDDKKKFADASKVDPHLVIDGLQTLPASEENVAQQIENRAFSQNRQTNRWKEAYVNSQGYTIEAKFQYHFDEAEGVTARKTGHGTASIWPMDSFAYSDGMFSGSVLIMTGVTVDLSGATENVDTLDHVIDGTYNLAAGELMWFKFGAAGRTGSAPNQGFTPTPWYSKRSCHYINNLIHLDFGSFSSATNYTQSLEAGSVGGAFFAPPWTAGRDRRAVDGPNKGNLIDSRGPFYDTYEEFYSGQKQLGQGMSLVPEFRISEHIDLYETENFGDYYAFNSASYSITGAADLSSSAQDGFMARYQNTDFIRFLNQFMIDDKEINGLPSDLSLQATGIQKVLPYDGFYPITRTLQLATLFSQSYSPGAHFFIESALGRGGDTETDMSGAGWQNVLDYFYAPGIMYNAIKSGIAVDHPVFINKTERFNTEPGEIGYFLSASTDPTTLGQLSNSSKDNLGVRQDNHGIGPIGAGNLRHEVAQFLKEKPLPRRLGTFEEIQPTGSENFLAHLFYFPDRLEFETIVNPTEYLLNNSFVNNQVFDWAANDITSSFESFANNKYVKGAGNFFGAVPEVFLENGSLTSIASDPNLVDPSAIPVQSGTLYTMEIALRKTDNFNLYSNPIAFGPPTATGSAFNESELLGDTVADTWTIMSDKYGSVLTANWGMQKFGFVNNPTSLNGGTVTGSVPSGSGWPLLHGNNAPHTPPYWYGSSWARIYFLPTGSGLLTLNEIIAQSQIEYGNDNDYLFDFRHNDLTTTDVSAAYGTTETTQHATYTHGSGGVGLPAYMWNRAWQNKMEIKASITVDNKHPGNIQPNDSWVIMPKWECPILDFPVREEPWATSSGSYNFTASFAKPGVVDMGLLPFVSPSDGVEVCPQQGMWHQYGVVPDAGEGVQMLIKDIGSGEKEQRMKATGVRNDADGLFPSVIGRAEVQFLPKIPNSLVDITETGDRKREVRSLAKLVGFPAEVVNQPVNLGKMADKKDVSEAMVALPYFKDADGQLQFIPIPLKDQSNQVAEIFGEQTARLRKALTKYVLPPVIERRMSFLTPESYPEITEEDLTAKPQKARLNDQDPPIAMYLFEFTTTFNKQDLADWWQGIMPEASKKFEKAKVYTIDHAMPGIGLQDFGAKPGAGGGKVDRRLRDLIDTSEYVHTLNKDNPGFRPDIQWMVFKVKQRAAGSYEEMIRNSLRAAGATIKQETGQVAYENRTKGFNWPYDYFSILELAKIDAGVTFTPDLDEIEGDGQIVNPRIEMLDGPSPQEQFAKAPTKRSPGKKRKVNKNRDK